MTTFDDVMLYLVLTSICGVLLACVVTSLKVVGGNVVRLNRTDPLFSQVLVENLHVLHDRFLGKLFSDNRHCAVVKEES